MRLRSSPGGVNAERRISAGMRLAMIDKATSAEADTTTWASTWSCTRCASALARTGSGSTARMLGFSVTASWPQHYARATVVPCCRCGQRTFLNACTPGTSICRQVGSLTSRHPTARTTLEHPRRYLSFKCDSAGLAHPSAPHIFTAENQFVRRSTKLLSSALSVAPACGIDDLGFRIVTSLWSDHAPMCPGL